MWPSIAPIVWIPTRTTIVPFATCTNATREDLIGATISIRITAKNLGIANIPKTPEGETGDCEYTFFFISNEFISTPSLKFGKF